MYTNVQECLSAQDPYCVWCSSGRRSDKQHLQLTWFRNWVQTQSPLPSCTFEEDCQDPDWLSIPDDSWQKIVSYKVAEDGPDQVQRAYRRLPMIRHSQVSPSSASISICQITLSIQMHMTVSQDVVSVFACQFSSEFSELCLRSSPPPQFPRCICILTIGQIPPGGQCLWLNEIIQCSPPQEPLGFVSCSVFF